MSTCYKTRLRPKGQITLPSKIREMLNLNAGDDLAFSVDEQGQVHLSRLEVIPPDQAWFWAERWQKMEREVEEDIVSGRVESFDSVDEFINYLDQPDENAKN